ncbi:MAG: DUF1700 domain-containing protein [Coriobacteriales bacterium]|nr:DUF1700 domain-containing protein [Coriobacteriales bacterium]
MDRQQFLSRLQQRIAILDEVEQTDIIDEYAQHIDLEVANGKSQEEAIAEFGDFDELVAEILSAYPSAELKPAEGDAGGGDLPQAAGVADYAQGDASAMLSIGDKLDLMERFSRLKDARERRRQAAVAAAAQATDVADGAVATPAGSKHPVLKSAAALPGKGARATGRGIIWLVRVALVVCLAVLLLFCVLTALAFMVGFGVSIVMGIQGYPLIGIALLCLGLGAIVCGLALLLLQGIRKTHDWKRLSPTQERTVTEHV